jgi:hypothetical protein
LSDFTDMGDLGISIAGVSMPQRSLAPAEGATRSQGYQRMAGFGLFAAKSVNKSLRVALRHKISLSANANASDCPIEVRGPQRSAVHDSLAQSLVVPKSSARLLLALSAGVGLIVEVAASWIDCCGKHA